METISIELSREVYRSDAEKIYSWLSDDDVTKNLIEYKDAKDDMMNAVNKVNMTVLTKLFNNNCIFYIIRNLYETVGFLKMVPNENDLEVVVAIGEKDLWGKGIGYAALIEALKEVFDDTKANKVVAKIKTNDYISKNLFKKIGFDRVKELGKEVEYHLTKEAFYKIA